MTELQNNVVRMTEESCLDVFVRIFQTINREQSVIFGMICWSLWNRRNKWIWDRANGSAFGVKAAAINLLEDWKRAKENGKKGNSERENGMQKWSKPPVGWKKINIDAATFQDGHIGVGGVIRDASGHFLRARCRRIRGQWQAREAEALSLKEVLLWAKSLKLDYCIVETDSKTLVEACKGKDGASYFHTIVSDCVDLCKHFENVLVTFVRRSANGVAHLLATHSMSDLQEWIAGPPEFIKHVLDSDII